MIGVKKVKITKNASKSAKMSESDNGVSPLPLSNHRPTIGGRAAMAESHSTEKQAEKRRARQAAAARARRARGLCIVCGRPNPETPKLICPTCREVDRLRRARRRDRLAVGKGSVKDRWRRGHNTYVNRMEAARIKKPALTGVYFLLWKDYVKVGVATDVNRRHKSFATTLPEGVTIPLGWIPSAQGDMYKVERRIHHQFGLLRVRGEWFLDSTPLRRYIERNASPWPVEVAR